MEIQCPACKAFHWLDERSYPSTKIAPDFELCCKKGDIALETIPDPPEMLKKLLAGQDPESKRFRENI